MRKSNYRLLNIMSIRNDAGGSGRYGASRDGGKRKHNGVDYSVKEGQEIKAPEDGLLVRKSYPYANDLRWEGFLFKGDSGKQLKVFYAKPLEALIGKRVKAGQTLATAQNIGNKYQGVTPHIHVEAYVNNERINPETIF